LFIVRGVNPETLKVIVGLKESKGRSAIKKIELSEENYYHLLYQPSLFNFEEL
jgi:ACT domain-containing protein